MPVLRWALVDRALYPGFGGRGGAPACRQECLGGALTPPGSSPAPGRLWRRPHTPGLPHPPFCVSLPCWLEKRPGVSGEGPRLWAASSRVLLAGDDTTGQRQLQVFTRQNNTATPLRTPGVKQGQKVSQLQTHSRALKHTHTRTHTHTHARARLGNRGKLTRASGARCTPTHVHHSGEGCLGPPHLWLPGRPHLGQISGLEVSTACFVRS